jgi:hypothetical protein
MDARLGAAGRERPHTLRAFSTSKIHVEPLSGKRGRGYETVAGPFAFDSFG